MANLTITAANLLVTAGNTNALLGTAGATITAGQVIYLDTGDTEWKLAQCDGTDPESGDDGLAIALHAALDGQPLSYINIGDLDFGAIITAGVVYVVSNTAGAIMPIADFTTSTWKFSPVGYGKSTTTMTMLCDSIGATLIALA